MSHPNKMPHNPREIVEYLRDQDIRMVDLRFADPLGRWQHFSVPAHELDVAAFERGFSFQGRLPAGPPECTRLRVIPDPATARVDPFLEVATVAMVATVGSQGDVGPNPFDPRGVAQRAEAYLKQSKVADRAFFAPVVQFYVFDDVRFTSGPNMSSYAVDAAGAAWNTNREEFPNLGHKLSPFHGTAPLPPGDGLHDLRTEMVLTLEEMGIVVERHQQWAQAGGQAQIDVRYDGLLAQADKLCWLKYVVKNVARRAGKTATFMPKPMHGHRGSGLPLGMSLWKDALPLFGGDPELSDVGRYFVGGILEHAAALCAFTNCSTNSYKRLVPGGDAPVRLDYGPHRGAAVRIPNPAESSAARVEFRTPDPSLNPYLAFSAVLMAGLDGIARQLEPESRPPGTEAPMVPRTLEAALRALEADHEFLLSGEVFSQGLLRAWTDWKLQHEVDEVQMRPHPHELALYYDV